MAVLLGFLNMCYYILYDKDIGAILGIYGSTYGQNYCFAQMQ